MGKKKKKTAKKIVNKIKKPFEIKHIKSKKGYEKYVENYLENYKKFLIIPFSLLIMAFVVIGAQIVNTGDFVAKGVSLSGGIQLTINSNMLKDTVLDDLKTQFPNSDIGVRTITSGGVQVALIVESADIKQEELVGFVKEKYSVNNDDLTVEETGSTLGERFFLQTAKAIIVAFFLMGMVVFFYFRTIIPSLAVILAAFSDIIVTLAVFNILGLKLTTAGIAAFLMLIGYSVDTDILLSTKVLKRKEGTVNDRIFDAFKTGIMMNFTTLAAVMVALIFSQSETLTQIMIILFIGLLVDMINTWIQNVGILKLYLDRK